MTTPTGFKKKKIAFAVIANMLNFGLEKNYFGKKKKSTCACIIAIFFIITQAISPVHNNFFFFLGWKSVDSVPKLVSEYMAKKMKVDEFVTHTLPFAAINEAFELMHTGKRLVYFIHFKY